MRRTRSGLIGRNLAKTQKRGMTGGARVTRSQPLHRRDEFSTLGPGMLLSTVLRYRLDLVAFVLLAALAAGFCWRLVRRRRPEEPHSGLIGLVLAVVIVLGLGAAEWAGEQRRTSLVAMFAGLGPTYAYHLQDLGHARIDIGTAVDDPIYTRLIETQKNWLRVNPLIADVYTFRHDAGGNVRFVVDSETDYDGDGIIRGAREERTAIGEIYEEATEDFHAALRGEQRFDTTFVPDRWGVWVASLTPIYDASGRVEAAVGIDYPGDAWLAHILSYRAVALAGAGVLVGIVLAGATIGLLMRAEIRERIAAQQQLRRDKDAADLVSRSKSEFISFLSHEVRSPLTALVGYASILGETPLNALQQRYARTISTAAEKLNAIVGDVLDLTQLEEGKLTVESAPFSPLATVHEVVDTATARAMEKGLALRFEHAVPDSLTIMGDSARLRQVLAHLLGNAIKFTDHGTVSVNLTWTSAGNGTGELTLVVADTGIGIAAERLARIFDPLSSPEPEPPRRRAARGVGLIICHRLVRLMGGEIDVQSTRARGSQFTVRLPAATVSDPAPAATQPAVGAHAPRLLLVDHEPLTRDILLSALPRSGYDVMAVNGIDEALRQLEQQAVAAVLVDVGGAGVHGTARVRRIRLAERGRARIPILALGDSTRRDARERCLAAGVDEYLAKPVYVPAVVSALAAFMLVRPAPARAQ